MDKPKVSSTHSHPGQALAVASLIVATIGAVAFLVLPIYQGAHLESGPSDFSTRGLRATGVNGIWTLVVGLTPVLISGTPLIVRQQDLRLITGVSAVLLSGFSIVGSASIGLFIVPSAVLEWAAFARSWRRAADNERRAWDPRRHNGRST